MLEDVFVVEGEANSWEEALKITSDELLKKGYVNDRFFNGCVEREKLFPTGLNSKIPVAIPHADAKYVTKQAICILKLKNPVKFRSMENSDEYVNVNFVFNMALSRNEDQLQLLQAIVAVVQDENFLLKAKTLGVRELNKLFCSRWMIKA